VRSQRKPSTTRSGSGPSAHARSKSLEISSSTTNPQAGANRSRRNSNSGSARAVFLAASTREGEEELLLDALEREPLGDALVVIVPRHPQRFDAVAQLIAARGLKFARRSAAAPVDTDCGIVLGDSMGEMAAYYRASDAAFVGGSLLPYGGQNLIEACAAGVPVLVGPYTNSSAVEAISQSSEYNHLLQRV
jgi:3-deoxy-D-manno-octulosonic-acid transferase